MVMRYMISDVDLAKDSTVGPQQAVAQPRQPSSRPRRRILTATKVRLGLLLMASITCWVLVYCPWDFIKKQPIWRQLTANKEMVTGIMYNQENPCALVYGEVVHEGDTIRGCRVIKIHRERVEFEKNGKSFAKQVH